jgi:phospholipase/carboxylesterase
MSKRNDSDKTSPVGYSEEHENAIDHLCSSLMTAIGAFEKARRWFDPGFVAYLRDKLFPFSENLEQSVKEFHSRASSPDVGDIQKVLLDAADNTLEGLRLFTAPAGLEDSLINVLRGSRKICRAQEILYPARQVLPSIKDLFLEVPARSRADVLDPDRPPETDVGLFHVGMDEDPYERGTFSLYVPESYDHLHAWPLVVALHGGYGHGRDFIWMWLREAKSRRFLLLAPTSRGITWSITGNDTDISLLEKAIGYVREKWNVDRGHLLLTGISDGGTYAFRCGLREKSPFTALAPISCVLPPLTLEYARRRLIFWVHGELDWMFPAGLAREGSELLRKAGAEVNLRVVENLSHTYPREENDRILTWFDPSLSLSHTE